MNNQLSLIISAGMGCFTCCKGCYQFFSNKQISTEKLLLFIREYKEKYGLNKITLAGGDPLTRKDIIYFVNELRKLDIKISMDTVGKPFIGDQITLFNQKDFVSFINPKEFVNKIDCIGIPLDGYFTEQINYFRNGISLEEIINILSELNKHEFNICINTVVHKKNINDLYKIYNIIKNYKNVKKWQLFQYTPTGVLGYNNRKMYEVDEELFKIKTAELKNDIEKSELIVEAKSNSYRKLNYLLVNSEGTVWQPNYNIYADYFEDSDKNSQNVIIGNITDDNIFCKIDKRVEMINNVDFVSESTCKTITMKEIVNC